MVQPNGLSHEYALSHCSDKSSPEICAGCTEQTLARHGTSLEPVFSVLLPWQQAYAAAFTQTKKGQSENVDFNLPDDAWCKGLILEQLSAFISYLAGAKAYPGDGNHRTRGSCSEQARGGEKIHSFCYSWKDFVKYVVSELGFFICR